MIGLLPTALTVDNISYPIRSDYFTALVIFQAFNDTELTQQEKALTCIRCLYADKIPPDFNCALKQACWFLDGGDNYNKEQVKHKKVIDWEQDEQIIFSAVNKVAGREIRLDRNTHWWTFLGFFNEIGEGLLSTVINIRSKRNKGEKLEKYELEFYRKHKSMIDLKQHYTADEQTERDRINSIFK